jgi:signal transduction histidine kinase
MNPAALSMTAISSFSTPPSPASLEALLAIVATSVLLLTLLASVLLLSNLGLRRELGRQRRAQAELLRQQRQAQDMADGRKRFIAYLSHESRNLVAGIFGSLDLAEQQPHDAALRPLALALHANAQSLLDLLDASLDAAQIDAGRFGVRPTPVDVLAVLERVAAQAQVGSHGNWRRPPLVHADMARGSLWLVDGVRLAQIVRNLVSNAMKYAGPADCRICVKAVPDAAGTRTRLCVRVVDSGPGLSADQRARLFADFERVGEMGDVAGVGLGLAISRRLAQAMGGDLSVASEVGAGCTFKLALPVTPWGQAPVGDAGKLGEPQCGVAA